MREKSLLRGKLFYTELALNNMKKKSKPVILYNLDKTVYGSYSSIIEAAKSINCSEKNNNKSFKNR